MTTSTQIPTFDVALFDAGLTLIHPVSTVEKIYARYAQRSGIPLDELVLRIRAQFKELFGEARREMAEGRDGYVWSDELDHQMWHRLCLTVAGLAFMQALAHTTVANTMFTMAAIPFITAGLAWVFLREKLSALTVITMLAAALELADNIQSR